jgi:hypothetical protein
VSRRTIAVAILAIWGAGLVYLYARTTTRTPEQELAEAGLHVSPATYYYTLQQNGRQVGAASSAIDTTNSRVVATDFVRGEIPVGNEVLKLEARSEARFTRGLRLRDFIIRADGDITPFMLRGVIQEGEDKTLRITAENNGDDAITQEAVVTSPVFLPTVAPLPLMLGRNPKVGDTARVSLYDPMSRSVKEVTLRIQADSLFLVADSASLDSATGRWKKARQDSLRGWRITGPQSPLTVWVDAYGRLIAASEPGGITLVRTAFEMAFENWRLDHLPAVPPSPGRVNPP